MEMEKFGFLYLGKNSTGDSFHVYTCCEKLYESIFECINDAKHANVDVPDHPDFTLKIAYFKVLNNHEIVKQIHSPTEICSFVNSDFH